MDFSSCPLFLSTRMFFQDGGEVHVVSEPGGVCCNMYVCMYVCMGMLLLIAKAKPWLAFVGS